MTSFMEFMIVTVRIMLHNEMITSNNKILSGLISLTIACYLVLVRTVLHKPLTITMSTIDLCDVTALFGVSLETNKHENLIRLT